MDISDGLCNWMVDLPAPSCYAGFGGFLGWLALEVVMEVGGPMPIEFMGLRRKPSMGVASDGG